LGEADAAGNRVAHWTSGWVLRAYPEEG
jgi:hypothetical protein